MKIAATIRNINEAIATHITLRVSTMWCVYAFTILALVPLTYPTMTQTIAFVSSSVLQLILLPLIMVGQGILSRKAEERAQQDHDTLLSEFADIKEIEGKLDAIAAKIIKLETTVRAMRKYR